MKKFVVLLIAVVASYTAQAQSVFGIKGGLNYSNLSGDLEDESVFNNKMGFHGGVYFNAPIVEDFLSIQPEILYSNKGYKYNDDVETTLLGSEYRYEGTANFNYIDVPVLARLKASGFFVEAGPQVSYLLSVNDKTKTYRNGTLVERSENEKSKSGYADFEIGYAAGLGFATSNGFNLGVRYNGALTDITDDSPEKGDFKDARHSAFQLYIGFPLSQ